ncbi:MAG: hypothetical protein ACON5A_03825 [Candidatus Comchoanobacterales bacterium]
MENLEEVGKDALKAVSDTAAAACASPFKTGEEVGHDVRETIEKHNASQIKKDGEDYLKHKVECLGKKIVP